MAVCVFIHDCRYASLLDMVRKLILSRPAMVRIVISGEVELNYVAAFATEVANDAADADKQSNEPDNKPKRPWTSVLETHALPFMLSSLLPDAVTDDATTALASRYEVTPPKYDRAAAFMTKYNALVAKKKQQQQ